MTKRPIKHLRWYIAILLCLASELNYLERQTLAVLIDRIQRELRLSNANYGEINSWFLTSYAVMYLVSGRIIDLVGTRRGLMIFVSGWSLANMLHVFARTAGQFSCFRFLLGIFEPGSFPGGVRAVSEWFPMRRGSSNQGKLVRHIATNLQKGSPITSRPNQTSRHSSADG